MNKKNILNKKQSRVDMFDEREKVNSFEKLPFNVEISKFNSKKNVYTIVNAWDLHFLGTKCALFVENLLKEQLLSVYHIANFKKILFVGLGNEGITADSLGAKVIKKLFFSSKLNFEIQTCGFCPSVSAKTGMETAETIKAVCMSVCPDLVVFIDTLASNRLERLGCSFQINNEGIAAGSGVGNINKFMNKRFLKTNCIVVGVPFMIYPQNLLKVKMSKYDYENLVLTPKNIDTEIEFCSEIIANAFNGALFPELSKDEIKNLI